MAEVTPSQAWPKFSGPNSTPLPVSPFPERMARKPVFLCMSLANRRARALGAVPSVEARLAGQPQPREATRRGRSRRSAARLFLRALAQEGRTDAIINQVARFALSLWFFLLVPLYSSTPY
jgi:hypothetical protein